MQLITAIIKPNKLEDVRNALNAIDISGITVTEVKGFSRQKGHTEMYRGSKYSIDFLVKIKLEIATIRAKTKQIINTIITSAKTSNGEFGDGKIFVSTLDDVVRIRTGESGKSAI